MVVNTHLYTTVISALVGVSVYGIGQLGWHFINITVRWVDAWGEKVLHDHPPGPNPLDDRDDPGLI
jgi:hypothetical protein